MEYCFSYIPTNLPQSTNSGIKDEDTSAHRIWVRPQNLSKWITPVSGIVGMFRRDGGLVDVKELEAMTDFLAYRGLDGKATHADLCAGFGHTLLRTTEVSASECQPAVLDTFWITADVRLDCREEFVAKLETAGRHVELHASDAMLILQSYAAWGANCVEHLRGDFSFAIWDTQAKNLFCARDHFGIKPFYYADLGDLFLFTNTLNCLRTHPKATNALNEAAIGDFLCFRIEL